MSDTPLVLVSGGSGYLGSAIAAAFLKTGWQPISLSRTDSDGGMATVICDVRDHASVEGAIQKIVAQYGKISAIVHAAAAPGEAPEEEQLAVALHGAENLAEASAPHMSAHAAFIGITTAFIEPDVHAPSLPGYLHSKMALRDYLHTLAVTREDLRVYAVAPGYMPGGLNEGVPQKVLDMMARKTGAGLTDATAVAKIVVALANARTAMPPGSIIRVPGENMSTL